MKRILAALSFFTRVPFWKLAKLEKTHYSNLVVLWPLAGWLTGCVMALAFWLSSFFLPIPVAVVIAIVSRIVLTGALHEDGYADFFDGFGGGRDRSSILRIMKDSHIGTYGVLALVLYFLLLYNVINSYVLIKQAEFFDVCVPSYSSSAFSFFHIAFIFIAADSFSKWTSSNIINILPYARTEDDAKNKLLYNKMSWSDRILCFILGVIPTLSLMPFLFVIPMFVSALVTMIMIFLFHKKLGGYTGDCCGACFVITELSYYITALVIIYN